MLAPLIEACRRHPLDRPPVWFMRQAGRYMAEYRKIRKSHSILEICKTPRLAAEVTLQPVDALGVDAAIIFADLLLPLEPMGLHLEFVAGDGPVIHNPVRSASDVEALRVGGSDELAYVGEAIAEAKKLLAGRVPLIGFRRRPVYARQLHDRRWLVEALLAREVADVLRARYMAPADGKARRSIDTVCG